MSDPVPDRVDTRAFAMLTRLVRHLGDELASYRRRALSAEARVKALEEKAKQGGLSPERSFEIEQENAELRARVETARERTKRLLDRVRFLRQQHDGVV